MSDEVFEYKLKVTADTAGAKATSQALDKVADSSKKLTEASKEETARRKRRAATVWRIAPRKPSS